MPKKMRADPDRSEGPVTRFEVIDGNGRSYTVYNADIELSYQDEGRTLKVFVRERNTPAPDNCFKSDGTSLTQHLKP